MRIGPRSLALALVLASRAGSLLAQPLTLEGAIETAQRQGYQSLAARAQFDAARYRDRAFSSRLLPQVSIGGTVPSYNRSIIQVLQPDGSTLFRPQDQTTGALTMSVSQRLPYTGGDLFITSALARLSVTGQQAFRSWSSTPFLVGLRQDLFRPNVLAWEQREQPVRYELATREYREAREDIALQITNLYFDAYAAAVSLDNAAKNAAVNDTLFTLNKGRLEVGKIGENDLLQSELALLRARNALEAARLEHERAVAALRLGLNLGPATPIALNVTTTVPDFPADTARAVTEALRNVANASQVELQNVQARRRVTEAKLSNGFGATVQASYGFNATAPEVSAVYQNLLEARRVSLSGELPLLQWGSRKESVQAAEADLNRATSLARAALDQVAHDARFAALQLIQARRTLALSAKADTVAAKRFEVAYNRYVIGRIAIDNLYIAQSEKDQALNQFVQSLRGYWVAHYRVRRATLFDFATDQPIR